MCSYRFDEHVGDAVFQLVGAANGFDSAKEYQPRSVQVAAHPAVWRRLLRIPAHKWETCHLEDILALLNSLASHFHTLRSFGSGASLSPSKRKCSTEAS